MPTSKALELAVQSGFDLIEVSPKAVPPVCRIMDFGHFLYRQKKAENKQKQLTKAQETKEIRFGIRISDHDFQVRVDRAQEFLEKHHPVKVILEFRGREASHPEIGMKRIEKMQEDLSEIAKSEGVKRQGRNIIVEFRPTGQKKG